MNGRGEFLENAEVHGYRYGTSQEGDHRGARRAART